MCRSRWKSNCREPNGL